MKFISRNLIISIALCIVINSFYAESNADILAEKRKQNKAHKSQIIAYRKTHMGSSMDKRSQMNSLQQAQQQMYYPQQNYVTQNLQYQQYPQYQAPVASQQYPQYQAPVASQQYPQYQAPVANQQYQAPLAIPSQSNDASSKTVTRVNETDSVTTGVKVLSAKKPTVVPILAEVFPHADSAQAQLIAFEKLSQARIQLEKSNKINNAQTQPQQAQQQDSQSQQTPQLIQQWQYPSQPQQQQEVVSSYQTAQSQQPQSANYGYQTPQYQQQQQFNPYSMQNTYYPQTTQYYGNYGGYPQQQYGGRKGGMGGGKNGGMGGGKNGGQGGNLRSLRASKSEIGGTAAKIAALKKQHGGQGLRRRPNNDGRRQLATEMSQLQGDYEIEQDYGSEQGYQSENGETIKSLRASKNQRTGFAAKIQEARGASGKFGGKGSKNRLQNLTKQASLNSNGPRTHQRFQKLREATADKSASKKSTGEMTNLSARRKNLAKSVLPPVEPETVDEVVSEESTPANLDEVTTTTLSTSTLSTTTVISSTETTSTADGSEDDLNTVTTTDVTDQASNLKHEKFRLFREKNFVKNLGENAKSNFNLYLHKEDNHKPNSDLLSIIDDKTTTEAMITSETNQPMTETTFTTTKSQSIELEESADNYLTPQYETPENLEDNYQDQYENEDYF